MTVELAKGLKVLGPMTADYLSILTPEALAFLGELHRKFDARRLAQLEARQGRQKDLDQGIDPDFLPETASIRQDLGWKVSPVPPALRKRHVEITGPTERKMMINALNSGADVFMADFEDANSPTWENVIQGQTNVRDAVQGSISFTTPEGKSYSLNPNPALLLVRPRGWHLNEKHVLVDGEEISGSLFDFGLFVFHNMKALSPSKKGPFLYLPKLESHLEARLWNDVFLFAQEKLQVPKGTIKATVLIETILAVFEMEEILFELREHSAGLNAGRWDYIFSIIKKFHNRPNCVLPDREQITMTQPFMRAYTELLVKTCHKRGAHAMGGMAAFIPSRKDPEVNERALRKVRDDKERESTDGFDGTWVAHPDLVPIAREAFDNVLGDKPNQIERQRDKVRVQARDLTTFVVEGGAITERGLRQNLNVAVQYIASWLKGVGAAALFNLMEDAATAEISRAQVWQWLHHGASLDDGRAVTKDLVKTLLDQECEKMSYDVQESRQILEDLIFSSTFADFLTLKAYQRLV